MDATERAVLDSVLDDAAIPLDERTEEAEAVAMKSLSYQRRLLEARLREFGGAASEPFVRRIRSLLTRASH